MRRHKIPGHIESGDDPNTGRPLTGAIVFGNCTLYTIWLVYDPVVTFNYRTYKWVTTITTKKRTYRLCAGELPKLESESEEEEYSRETDDFPDDLPSGGGDDPIKETVKIESHGMGIVDTEPKWGVDFDNESEVILPAKPDFTVHGTRHDQSNPQGSELWGQPRDQSGTRSSHSNRTTEYLYVMPLDAAPIKHGSNITGLQGNVYKLFTAGGKQLCTITPGGTITGAQLNKAIGSTLYDPDGEYELELDSHEIGASWSPYGAGKGKTPTKDPVTYSANYKFYNIGSGRFAPAAAVKPIVNAIGSHGSAGLLNRMGYAQSGSSASSYSTANWTLRHSDGSPFNAHEGTQTPSPGQLQVYPPSLSPIASALGSGWSKSTTTKNK